MAGRCLITGCNFVDKEARKYIHGDLTLLGADIYIFNATGCQWVYESPPMAERNVNCEIYYEKNELIVFHKKWSWLNMPAIVYLRDTRY